MHRMASMELPETIDWFKFELNRYLEALEIEGYVDIGKNGR